MQQFQVHILAADRTFYDGPCVSLTVPTSDGELGILAHHSPIIAAVQPGTLRYQAPDEAMEAILQKKSIQEYQVAQGTLARALNRLRVKSSYTGKH